MEIIKLDQNEYYNAEDVYKLQPYKFPNCGTKVRNIIEVKKLKENDYVFLKLDSKTKTWVPSISSYPRAKLFITKKWVDKNVIKNKSDNETVETYKMAPPVLELNENEKFKDENGNILDIEVRGERNYEKVYFKLENIVKSFGLNDNLNTVITNVASGYERGIDYETFTVNQSINYGSEAVKNLGLQKRIFLTYNGLIRMLFVSRSKQAVKFQKWAYEILFTHHLGTKEQKEEIASKLLGVPSKMVKDVLKRSISPISCIYLFTLGKVKHIRKSFNIPIEYHDDDIIVKYGRTENLEERTSEHEKDYGKIEGVELKLRLYSYIDSTYVVDAETDLANFFKYSNLKYSFPKRNELAIIPKDKINMVEKEYDKIRKIYAGNFKEIISEKEKLLNEIALMKVTHEKEIMKKDYLLELKDKDLEIYKLKLELLSKK